MLLNIRTTKVSAPDIRRFYCSFLSCFFSSLEIFNFINFIQVLRAVERRQSRPVFPARTQRLGVAAVAHSVGVSAPSLTRSVPGPRSRHTGTGPSPSRFASGLMNVRSCRTLDSCRINFDFQSFFVLFLLISFTLAVTLQCRIYESRLGRCEIIGGFLVSPWNAALTRRS